jgi:hypothetical protein
VGLSVVSGCYCSYYPYYPYDTCYPYPCDTTTNGTLTVANHSQSTITQLLFARSGTAVWGPNLLGNNLQPGEQAVATLDCDYWDILVGDEFGRQCVRPALYVCQTNDVWVVEEETLRSCSSF